MQKGLSKFLKFPISQLMRQDVSLGDLNTLPCSVIGGGKKASVCSNVMFLDVESRPGIFS